VRVAAARRATIVCIQINIVKVDLRLVIIDENDQYDDRWDRVSARLLV